MTVTVTVTVTVTDREREREGEGKNTPGTPPDHITTYPRDSIARSITTAPAKK